MNKGLHQTKTSKQHVFIDQIALFLAVALYWAGPKYACVLWLTLVTSRRISETLLLRGPDILVQGGEHHDAGHILFQGAEQTRDVISTFFSLHSGASQTRYLVGFC